MSKKRVLYALPYACVTILILAVAVFIPIADDLWLWVAYENDRSGTVSTTLVFGAAHPRTAIGDFDRVERKRVGWIPGPDWILSYTCGQCLGELHDECRTGNEAPVSQTNIQNVSRTEILMFHCICPDLSH